MNHHSRYDVSQRKRCDVPQEVPHGDNLLYGRRTPRRTHYTARPLMTRRTFSPSPPPPSPRYRSRHHTHKSNRSRAPFPLRPFGGVPSASPARSQIDAYGIGRRRSCELHHGKSSFHAGYPPQHATARGGGASDTPPLYPALGKQPHERLYPPSERCFVSEWGFHLAGKTGLRLAIYDGRKFTHSSFCGCTLQPPCNKLNSEGTEHPPPRSPQRKIQPQPCLLFQHVR